MGKRIKAALLCKTLPKDDNPAEYVNGSTSSPSRNLVTAIKLAGYVVHCGTGGKVSAVDGDGREVRDATGRAAVNSTCFFSLDPTVLLLVGVLRGMVLEGNPGLVLPRPQPECERPSFRPWLHTSPRRQCPAFVLGCACELFLSSPVDYLRTDTAVLFDFQFSNASRYVNLLRVPNLLWLSSFLLWFPGWLGWLVAVALMQPPSMYTKEEFHNNVLPRAAENQPPRILNDLRQLSCRLVASGIAKGLLKAEDLPEIRKTLIARFEVRAGLACVGVPVPWVRFCIALLFLRT